LVAVRTVNKGAAPVAVDSPSPVTAAVDMCLVKLLVGPGTTAEMDRTARSYSEGIGIEVWLPAPAAWNERIRNYGGGWVGGGHRTPGQIGSKVPALVNANLGYAVGTTDADQPGSQDGSFNRPVGHRQERPARRRPQDRHAPRPGRRRHPAGKTRCSARWSIGSSAAWRPRTC
jgi:hypothetical protein